MPYSWMSMLCLGLINPCIPWYQAHPCRKQALIDAVHEHSIDITAEFCPEFTQRHLTHLNTEHLRLVIQTYAAMQLLALMWPTQCRAVGLDKRHRTGKYFGVCSASSREHLL